MGLFSKFFSKSLLSVDILDKDHHFDRNLKCNFTLKDHSPNESFLGANAFVCIGKMHNFEKYGETKISDSFSVGEDDEYIFNFDLFVPYDHLLTDKEMFVLVEVYKNSFFKKRAVAILKINELKKDS